MTVFLVGKMGAERRQSEVMDATSSCRNAVDQAFRPGEWRPNRHARKDVPDIDAAPTL